MLHIRIAETEEQGKIVLQNINIDINYGSIIGICGVQKRKLVLIMAGKEKFKGDIVLGCTSLKGDIEAFQSEVSIILESQKINNTTLTVSDYIEFCELMLEENDDKMMFWKQQLLNELNLSQYLNILVKNLPYSVSVKLIILIAFIKIPKLVIIEDFVWKCDERSCSEIIEFLKNYVSKENSILLMSGDKIALNHLCLECYEIK